MANTSFRRWTKREKALVRSRYVPDGAAALARRLGRTKGSVIKCAQREGIVRHRRWTPEEDERLRMLWGERSIAFLCRTFKRPESGIYFRAWKIGIRKGPPQGKEYIESAMRRTGFGRSTLLRILQWAGVKVYRPSRQQRCARYHFGYVDPFDVDAAVARWCATETLYGAAKRHRIHPGKLARRLRAVGKMPRSPGYKKHLRVDSDVVDKVMATFKRCRTLTDQAARVGVGEDALRRWLRADGLSCSGYRWLLEDEVVDAVVRHRVAQPGCRAPAAPQRRRNR